MTCKYKNNITKLYSYKYKNNYTSICICISTVIVKFINTHTYIYVCILNIITCICVRVFYS